MSKSHFMRRMVLLSMALFAVACDSQATDPTLAHSPLVDKLAFTCTHEKDRFPPIDPKVDSLYRYARYLKKHNLINEDPAVFQEMERLYRIATAHDDYRANLSLRKMILRAQADSDDQINETLDLTERLIQQNLAGGYYDMATYIERGIGVEADTALALQYYRKSADMGSPEGQYYVSEQLVKLGPYHPGFAIAERMLRCAADQGHQQAASEYAIDMKLDKKPAEALRYYHLAVKNGSASAAFALADNVFPYTLPPSDPDYVGVTADPERARRYREISKMSSAQRHITQFFAQHTPFPQVTVHKHRRPRVLERWLGYAESRDPALQWELVAYPPQTPQVEALLAATPTPAINAYLGWNQFLVNETI